MKVIIIIIFTFTAINIVFAKTKGLPESTTITTGIEWSWKWQEPEKCINNHNLARQCYSIKVPAGTEGGYFPESCKAGTKKDNNTISTIINCVYKQKSLDSKCSAIQKKFLSTNEICSVDDKTWSMKKSCYGKDQQKLRQKLCPSGCNKVPKYHVCDWTQDQYNKYKNCNSVKYLVHQTRETICPSGMPDVHPTSGPPPRLNILRKRVPHFPNFLTFRRNKNPLKIEISSISGANAEVCHKVGTNKPCTKFSKIPSKFKVSESKFIYEIPAKELSETQHVFMVKNISTGTKAGLRFDINNSESYIQPASSIYPSATWIELLGPELTPIMPMTGAPPKTSGDYNGHACSTTRLYVEEKDGSGRRWKCIPDLEMATIDSIYDASGTYNYMEFGTKEETAKCIEETRCNSFGNKYDIKICTGGMKPEDDTKRKWMPFVVTGQYIYYYPPSTPSCNPN